MNFDPLMYRFPSRRTVIYAKNGMTCSTSPLASSEGLHVLQEGGNAMDAALTMAMMLALTEPGSNDLGSDCFVMYWNEKKQKLYGINGSGRAPLSLSASKIKAMGYTEMPKEGWIPVMVPGAVSAWGELSRRFGSKPLRELAEPAIRTAREGFPVPVNGSRLWKEGCQRFVPLARENPELFSPWIKTYTKDGEPYHAGEVFRNPDFADSLEEIANTDGESLYRGTLSEKIAAWSDRTGGFISKEDFRDYHPVWADPVSVRYRGYDIFEMPPNGHGITVLMAMNLLKGLPLGKNRFSPETLHQIIEATKLSFTDAKTFVADPDFMKTPLSALLSEKYADARRREIGRTASMPKAGMPWSGDTVYFCTADGEGNMVSFIQSHYMTFGSGVVVPGTGIALQNRGANFSLDPESDNCIAGGKRSYHTIIPGFLMKDGKPIGPFGIMGGFMQPQAHIQVLLNLIDYNMNPQEALDAPRFQWTSGKKIQIEPEFPEGTAESLRAAGHDVEIVRSRMNMGRGQIIWKNEDGIYCGGTEPRADGSISAY